MSVLTLSLQSTAPPRSINSLTISKSPLAAAVCNGVYPFYGDDDMRWRDCDYYDKIITILIIIIMIVMITITIIIIIITILIIIIMMMDLPYSYNPQLPLGLSIVSLPLIYYSSLHHVTEYSHTMRDMHI
jgi:hypothetical protein